jgi:hypothetical protein
MSSRFVKRRSCGTLTVEDILVRKVAVVLRARRPHGPKGSSREALPQTRQIKITGETVLKPIPEFVIVNLIMKLQAHDQWEVHMPVYSRYELEEESIGPGGDGVYIPISG